MGSLNKALLMGNVGKDPEFRSLGNGKEVANFTLATSDSWIDKSTNERKTETEWHKVVVYNEKVIKFLKEHLKKGSPVFVEGRIKYRKWKDKNDKDQYSTEIIIQQFEGKCTIFPNGNNKDAISSEDDSKPDHSVREEELDDEVPF